MITTQTVTVFRPCQGLGMAFLQAPGWALAQGALVILKGLHILCGDALQPVLQ